MQWSFPQVFRAFESARGVDELFEIAELIVNPAQYLSQKDDDDEREDERRRWK